MYDIKISINRNQGLPDVFGWLHTQGWTHIKDWRWFHPKQDSSDSRYTFQFDKEEYAVLFTLRWT